MRMASASRGVWQRYKKGIGIKEIARAYSCTTEAVQEIPFAVRDSLFDLLMSAHEGPRTEDRPPKLADALPTIINGALLEDNGWCAMKWSNDDLTAACNGDTMVPVEVSINGGDYRDLYNPADGGQGRHFEAGVPVPLSFLMEHIQQLEDAPNQSAEDAREGLSIQAQSSQGPRLYLAQQDVTEVLPELADAVPTSPPFREARDRMHQRSVWLGPKGTQTPLHCDPYHNLLCQVWGTKLVRLYSPVHTQRLHPFPTPFLRNTSQVDVMDPQPAKFLGFQEVPYMECWLKQGQMLFIPRKWWHFVQSTSSSLSISYWWTDDRN